MRRLRVFVDALEVSDDLDLLSRGIRKEGGFGTCSWVPSRATSSRRQASVALAAESMADKIWNVSCWYRNGVGCLRRRHLRRCCTDQGECVCENEPGAHHLAALQCVLDCC